MCIFDSIYLTSVCKIEYLFIGPGCSQNFGHKGAKVFFQSSYYSYSSVYGMYRETYVLFEKERERKKFEKGGKQKDTARETHLVGLT